MKKPNYKTLIDKDKVIAEAVTADHLDLDFFKSAWDQVQLTNLILAFNELNIATATVVATPNQDHEDWHHASLVVFTSRLTEILDLWLYRAQGGRKKK